MNAATALLVPPRTARNENDGSLSLQRKCACGANPGFAGVCTECYGKNLILQRRPTSPATSSDVPPIVHEVLRSNGQPLEPSTRRFMESRLGHDFRHVRIHTDTKAAESARSVSALAYTVGPDVVFGMARYAPRTAEGRSLLAHELVHVAQQTARPTGPIGLTARGDPDEREADAAAGAIQAGRLPPRVQATGVAGRLARVAFGEAMARFFGGGTFSDEELLAYLRYLDIHDQIEDAYDSDNKARAVTAKWKSGDGRFVLPVRRKTLLIQEMMSGFTGDDDERAILELLEGASDTEIDRILGEIGETNLLGEFHTAERDELEIFLAEYRARRAGLEPAADATRTPGGPVIERVMVNQDTTQTVTVHWSDGRRERDICSTGKGSCCVDPEASGPAVSAADTRVGGSAWTPVGDHTVAFKRPESSSGVKLWTEFVNRRDIALHYYRPVDGTPLSHGCVRLNWDMAQTIYDGSVAANDPRVRRGKLAPTRVRVEGLPRPRCDYAPLQREWAGDFATAGTRPPDGEAPEQQRERAHIARTRRQLRRSLSVSDAELNALIERLRTQTGGLPTDISPGVRARTLEAVAPVGVEIPRCSGSSPRRGSGSETPTGRGATVQRKPLAAADTTGVSEVAAGLAAQALRGPGQPLDDVAATHVLPHIRSAPALAASGSAAGGERQEEEARRVEQRVRRAPTALTKLLGVPEAAPTRTDFSAVRIHTDIAAAVSARALNAAAYTIGNHIAFAPGRYAPHSREGRALLAHELTHVNQQRTACGQTAPQCRVASNYAEIEDRLSYGFTDWAITDREAREVLEMMAGLSDQDLAETVAAMDRDDLVERLLDNVSEEDRERFAVLIARIARRRSVTRSAKRIIDRLTYGVFDWAITDQDARDALQALLGLESQQLRTVVGQLVNAGVFDRLLENLPEVDQQRFAGFIERLRRIRAEFSALVTAHLAFLRSRPGGAGRTVRERVEETGYGGSRATWNDLDPETQRDWRRRARTVISAVIASLHGTELEPIIVRSELVFDPEEAERNNAYAYVHGANRLFFGRGWVRDAEENVRNVWQSIAHELGGHEEFGATWSWEIMRAAVARLTPEERAQALRSANSLYSAYGYLETEIYAELRELPHRIETSGGDEPAGELGIRKQLQQIRDAFGPVVGRQIVLRLYYRVFDDPRVDASARRLLYEAVQEIYGLFPIVEPVAP